MTVYVHQFRGQGKFWFGRTASPDPWFALTADTDGELHAFAGRLGLTRVMYRPGTPAGPRTAAVAAHYDVTMGERDRAVALGAQPISAKEADQKAQQRALGLG
jgi:Protein of unknown function (DUF4031)